MAKRFSATEIWEEDWFLDMPNEYKLFWHYMLATCDHAGLFKVNLRSFCGLLEVKVTPTKALLHFNAGKQRIRLVSESVWFIEDFFVFQYGPGFNPKNRVHESISKLYEKNGISIDSVRGLIDPNHGVKDKDKDISKEELMLIIKQLENNSDKIPEPQKQYFMYLVVEMARIFIEKNPEYFFHKETDYHACLDIAYNIAQLKHWKKDEVVNGRMKECLISWEKISDFIKSDDWLSKRPLSDIAGIKEWQRLVQKMNSVKPDKKRNIIV